MFLDALTVCFGVTAVENDYENVQIDGWAEHVRQMHCNSDIRFTEEYEEIGRATNTQDLTWTNSIEPANLSKNRYNNIVACTHTRIRVALDPTLYNDNHITLL